MNSKIIISSFIALNCCISATAMEAQSRKPAQREPKTQSNDDESAFSLVFAALPARTKTLLAENPNLDGVSAEETPILFSRNKDNKFRDFDNMAFSLIEIDGEIYACAEEIFHYKKYCLFKQEALWNERFSPIKNRTVFKDLMGLEKGYTNMNNYADAAKRVGQMTFEGFNDAEWKKARFAVLFEILKEKFTQNAKLAQLLMSTGEAMIYEFAPNDAVYGTGRDGLGENRLGILLVELRSWLKNESLCKENPNLEAALQKREAAAAVKKAEEEQAKLKEKADKENAAMLKQREDQIKTQSDAILNERCPSYGAFKDIESKFNQIKREIGTARSRKTAGFEQKVRELQSEQEKLDKEFRTAKAILEAEKNALIVDKAELRAEAEKRLQEAQKQKQKGK